MMPFKSLCANVPLMSRCAALQPWPLPSAGVKVLLEKQDGNPWAHLHSGITNERG